MQKKVILFILAAGFSLFIFTKPTLAFGGEVIQNVDTVISKGQSVENVVILGNNATIKGTVRDNIIVVDGNVNIEESAKVSGVVLVIGGQINQDPGAKVTDNVLNFSFGNGASLGFLVSAILLVTSWSLRLGFSLLFILLAIIASLLGKQKINTVSDAYQKRPIRLIIIGAITSILLIPISILLIVSIIGIPVVVLLLVLWLIFFVIGIAGLSILIGKILIKSEERSQWLNVLFGSLIIIGLMNLPFIGFLLVLTLFWISTGYMITWIFQRIKFRKTK